MSAQKHHHTFAVIVLLGVVLLFVLLVFSFYKNSNSKNAYLNNTLAENNIYTSEVMGISFFVPDGFKVDDKTLSLSLRNNDGELTLVRNGTNFSNLEDYVSEFEARRNLKGENKKELLINDLDSISDVYSLENGVSRKTYFIYGNNFVYVISTDVRELYDELDQVAQSFRYTGN